MKFDKKMELSTFEFGLFYILFYIKLPENRLI